MSFGLSLPILRIEIENRAGRRIAGFLGDFESRKVSDAVSRFSLPRLGAVSQRRRGSPS